MWDILSYNVVKREERGRKGREVEKKWTASKLLFIPIAIIAFIAYISVTSNDPKLEPSAGTPEVKLEQVLSEMEGVGKVKVYFHYEQSGSSNDERLLSDYFRSNGQESETVSGMLVVSEGASNPTIKLELQKTISGIMQMPAHRIMIVPMENKGDEQ